VSNKRLGFSAAKLIGGGLAAGARLMTRTLGGYYGARTAAHASGSLAPVITIRTPRGLVRYRCPSATVAKHAWKLLDREPDTIGWIDEHVKPGDHLWDVGANIGAFSVYACLREGVSATAFEPVAGNFDVLTQAVILNGLGERVTPLAMGLSDETRLLTIYLIDTEAGAGLHALDAPVNVRGSFEAKAAVTVPVMRGDDAIVQFGVKAPTHIKIDVDGHEMRVLKGMTSVLASARTVWIEMTDDAQTSGENARLGDYLGGLGFEERRLASGLTGENRLFVNRKI